VNKAWLVVTFNAQSKLDLQHATTSSRDELGRGAMLPFLP
jgi:hypothetical protein